MQLIFKQYIFYPPILCPSFSCLAISRAAFSVNPFNCLWNKRLRAQQTRSWWWNVCSAFSDQTNKQTNGETVWQHSAACSGRDGPTEKSIQRVEVGLYGIRDRRSGVDHFAGSH